MIRRSAKPVKYDDRIDKEKLIDMVSKMVQLLQSREGDVDTEDGTYATVNMETLLHLEQEFESLFGVSVEEVTNLSNVRWLVSGLRCML